jgi:hypothetical protein
MLSSIGLTPRRCAQDCTRATARWAAVPVIDGDDRHGLRRQQYRRRQQRRRGDPLDRGHPAAGRADRRGGPGGVADQPIGDRVVG